ncbi:putative mitochondrial hypothetical protein [Leptomonas pyrrhocoris]|uniref:Uncharacterized protein n=1 Tax=Leptomonas pyrrhocoris TaxID=157538 RepID=A0A0N0DXT5_LEPPY|nr:putative mitochondrial hypothetical protein [Leptomonas pyrrhocoris]XP_015661621.1 putative mitochondrial hypothetical protein [Leptomonas pyrrhocoris]KPA83181.1 putative mitochondrial hypothetical protein [Leptomonas pyrrhocoris]KPA83182.1 putative mitochondrial hypothetical protein [Leptomonas pyrrhocoris]|eukprot:XP_015661620.1 putative mitochondrial hypothetical protein [Leptomonas pyrrhocoris]
MAESSWLRSVLALVATVLCLTMAVVPVLTAAAATYAPPPFPSFEKFFAQQFRVSVMTQSYGVFNASLRMRGSMNFPERVQGELIPLGVPRLNSDTQTPLPHFQRVRNVEDDKLSDLPVTLPGKKDANAAASGEEERPSLFALDLQLLHSDSPQVKAQVYYLPAEVMALRSQREAMSEGSVAPAATVDFAFRVEARQMSNNPLSDTAALARVSAATMATGRQKATEAVTEAGEATSAAAAAAAPETVSNGDVIFRWITEHEFSAVFFIPVRSAADKDGAAASHLERVWVYGYTAPSPDVFDRKQRQVPWYQKYVMLSVALVGFVVQIISGWTEGKTKALNAVELEHRQKMLKEEKMEKALKEQGRQNKKKK